MECEATAKANLTKCIENKISIKSCTTGSIASKLVEKIGSLTEHRKPIGVPTFATEYHMQTRLIALGTTYDFCTDSLTVSIENDLFIMI